MRQRSSATTSAPAPVPAAASAPAPSSPPLQKSGFPDGLTEWVKRHFEIAVTDADKADVENRIRVYISELGSQLWSKNWKTETMILPPHLQLQRRHEQPRNHSGSFSSSSSSSDGKNLQYAHQQPKPPPLALGPKAAAYFCLPPQQNAPHPPPHPPHPAATTRSARRSRATRPTSAHHLRRQQNFTPQTQLRPATHSL